MRPAFLIALVLLIPAFAHADTSEVEKAVVVSVESSEIQTIPGTDTSETVQMLSARILEGTEVGKTVDVENDYLGLKAGDTFFLAHDGASYTVDQPDRLPALGVLLGIFVFLVAIVGGWTGVRGLLALGVSILAFAYVLLPGILAGYDPIIIAAIVASVIIIIGSYLTHGVSRTTTAAVAGMIATIILTSGIAWWAVAATQLTGMGDENAVYLNLSTAGGVNVLGILLAAMVIGMLGILYDAAISQAVAVEELLAATPTASRLHIWRRAMRIGREHIGALVNTLAIAYVGAALPLLLLFKQYADQPFLITANQEIFATEIVRAVVGSIGIVLAVPISTLAAIWLLMRTTGGTDTIEPYGNNHS